MSFQTQRVTEPMACGLSGPTHGFTYGHPIRNPCFGLRPRRRLQNASTACGLNSEVVFEAELDVAGADLGATDDTEVARSVARGRIAEHRMVAHVGCFEPEFSTLTLSDMEALEKSSIESVDSGSTDAERTSGRSEGVRSRARERGLVEVVVEAIFDAAGRRRITD